MNTPVMIPYPTAVPPFATLGNLGWAQWTAAGMAGILLTQSTLAMSYVNPGDPEPLEFPTPSAVQMGVCRNYIMTGAQAYASQVTKEPVANFMPYVVMCQLQYDNWCNHNFGSNVGGVPVPPPQPVVAADPDGTPMAASTIAAPGFFMPIVSK